MRSWQDLPGHTEARTMATALIRRRHQSAQPNLRAHLAICRFDHWFKNVFVLPGIVVALGMDPALATLALLPKVLLGLLAIGCVASSNYVINEIQDGPFDRHHPQK